MRVLLATYWPFPHTGGVFTYLNILQARLEEQGHEVELLAQHYKLEQYYLVKSGQCFSKQKFVKEAEHQVLSRFGRKQLELTPWMIWRETEKLAYEKLCQTINLTNYDVVHTQDILSTFAIGRVKPESTPLVATIHGCLATEWVVNHEIKMRTALEQEYLSMEEYFGAMSADGLILPSKWLREKLASFQVNHPRSHIIYYGLDQKRYRLQNGGYGHSKQTIIACPARMVAIKGHAYLLEAMQLLLNARKNIQCWLIGDGVLRLELEHKAEQLGIQEHVKFLGIRQDVDQLLTKADIVVLPSLQDNLPFSILEAQSLGKPVVASRIGGIVEMIEDGVNGYLFEAGQSFDLYEKLLPLIDNRKLRKTQSIAAKKRALALWNDTVMVGRTIEVYERAVRKACVKTIKKPEYDTRLQQSILRLSPSEQEMKASPNTLTMMLTGMIHAERPPAVIHDRAVHLIDISGVVLRTARSDAQGRFYFHHVPPGNYELSCWLNETGKMKTIKVSVNGEMNPLTIQFEI